MSDQTGIAVCGHMDPAWLQRSGLVWCGDHGCWRISGFSERPDTLSPRAPMDFRALLPYRLQGIGLAGPQIRFKKRGSYPVTRSLLGNQFKTGARSWSNSDHWPPRPAQSRRSAQCPRFNRYAGILRLFESHDGSVGYMWRYGDQV